MTDANTSNTDDLRAAAKTLRLLAESISWWRSVKGGERPWVLDGDEAAALLTIWESVDKREAAKGKREWLIVRKWRYGKKHL